MSAFNRFWWLGVAALLACFSQVTSAAQPEAPGSEMTLEVKLIWSSNAENSPDPNHRKVDTELTKWLSNHYKAKWTNYFQVKAETIKVPVGSDKQVQLSHGNSVEIKNCGTNQVEARLVGPNKDASKVATKGSLPRNERRVIGGPDKNDSAWFVVIRNISPK